MDHLYAPWRKKYVQKIQDSMNTENKICVFCNQLACDDDATYFILGRYTHHAIIMNLYPYNAGHLLIVPFAHVQSLEELSTEARTELIALANESICILKKELNAHGINMGLNLGKAAGAGIPEHLHMHILPRWVGDTNFLPLLAETKQISIDLHEIYKKLQPAFKKLMR